MGLAAHGRIFVWEGISLWLLGGEAGAGDIDFHAHHAIQITLSVEGAFTLSTEANAVHGPAAIVAADARHQFITKGVAALLFVEPESAAGRVLAERWLGRDAVAALPAPASAEAIAAFGEAWHGALDETEVRRIALALIDALGGKGAPQLPDARVAKMIDHCSRHLDDAGALKLVAGAAGLSPSRARHLFVEQTGLPVKSYILWLRLKQAVQLNSAGRSLTEAAHTAGFADSAHFSRTFRRMFGVAAASLRVAG